METAKTPLKVLAGVVVAVIIWGVADLYLLVRDLDRSFNELRQWSEEFRPELTCQIEKTVTVLEKPMRIAEEVDETLAGLEELEQKGEREDTNKIIEVLAFGKNKN